MVSKNESWGAIEGGDLKSNQKQEEKNNTTLNDLQFKSVKYVLPKTSDTYELDKFKKRSLLLINNKYIQNHQPRYGTEEDVHMLTRTFSNLQFDVNIFSDLNRMEVINTLDKFVRQDFTDYGCVVVAVLTHGTEKGLLYARDEPYSEMDIFDRFTSNNVPTLASKPKIFIVQACRGFNVARGVRVWNPPISITDTSNTIMFDDEDKNYFESAEESSEKYLLPVDSDMLILHSSHMGKLSYRNVTKGSWFIQSLCKQINLFWDKLDFESILIKVKRDVAIDHSNVQFDRKTDSIQHHKQMPVITSTLIRKLYFMKYEETKYISRTTVLPERNNIEQMKMSKKIEEEDCFCYQKHFEYMKQCLKYYIEDHPDDNLAQCFHKISQEFKGPAFNEPKKTMINIIIKHLKENKYENLKYMYTQNKCNTQGIQ